MIVLVNRSPFEYNIRLIAIVTTIVRSDGLLVCYFYYVEIRGLKSDH